jgi:hypothetical protein
MQPTIRHLVFPPNTSIKSFINPFSIVKHLLLLFPFCFLLTTAVCGQTTTVNRNLEPFDQINISGGFDKVLLKEGAVESVALEVSGVDPEKITTEVKNHTLMIGMKNGHYGKMKSTITVTYKSLNALHSSGSSDIATLSPIKSDDLKIRFSGSGDFKGELNVGKLEVNLSGSSDMTFSGRAEHQRFWISGSGDIKANTLSGKDADVAISGSGDVKLDVEGPVNSRVSGSGNVSNH